MSSSAEHSGAKIIDGRQISRAIHEEVQEGVRALRAENFVPHLVAVQVGGDTASEVYVENQRKRFAKLGIEYTHDHLAEDTTVEVLEARIDELNGDPSVTGIMVTLPLPAGIPAHRLQDRIRVEKDVEGVSPASLGALLYGRYSTGPCTALAVLAAIRSTEVPLVGKNAVVIGRSNIVGKPVGILLLHERVTVTTCHTATRELNAVSRSADIVIAAAGRPRLISEDMVGEGAMVIDVGIHRVEGKTVGDVDFDAVSPKAGWITPVPGGIGPMTVAMLAKNTLECARVLRHR